jgi:hypothetical protein
LFNSGTDGANDGGSAAQTSLAANAMRSAENPESIEGNFYAGSAGKRRIFLKKYSNVNNSNNNNNNKPAEFKEMRAKEVHQDSRIDASHF